MLFNECFDTLVLVSDHPFNLKGSRMVKRINSSRNCLAPAPVLIAADPFLSVKDDTLYLFYEEYRYRAKGIIKMTSTQDLISWSHPRVVLEQEFHLSYPWVFQHNDQWYMIPETSATHEIRLYKAVDNSLNRFEYLKTLLAHDGNDQYPLTDYCDSSIVEKNGTFYLFTTLHHGAGNELHLFYSDALDGNYTPHPMSPVVVNDECGRNGGHLLEHDGALYRFAQNCNGGYGNNISIFEVAELSHSQYKEALVQKDALTQAGFSAGHQYNFVKFRNKYIIAIDQKRRFPFFTCKVKRLFNLFTSIS